MAADYKLLEARSPTLGLANHIAPTDISPRNCSFCQNVYFEDGAIRKRFGFGEPLIMRDRWGRKDIHGTRITDEIVHLAIHEDNYAQSAASTSRFMIAMTLNDGFEYIASQNRWDYGTWASVESCASTTNFTARNGHSDITFSGVKNDMTAGWRNLVSSKLSLYVEIDSANAAQHTFKWGLSGAAGAIVSTKKCCLSTAFKLVKGGNDLCYVAFGSQGGHTIADSWQCAYDWGNNSRAKETTIVQEGAASIKTTVGAGHGTGVVLSIDPSIIAGGDGKEFMTRCRFWFYSTIALADGELQLYFIDKNSDVAEGVGGTAPKEIDIPATPATRWIYHDISLGGQLGTSYILSNFVFGIKVNKDRGAMSFYIDGMSLPLCFDLSETATELEKTHSYISISSGTSRTYFTNYTQGHHVRYFFHNQTGSVINLFRILFEGDDYNTTDKWHSCRALTNLANHLQLWSTREEASGTRKRYEIRTRFSDLNDVLVWDTGTSGNTDLADTGGAILSAVTLLGNVNAFKSDSIIRCQHLGGETGVYGYRTIEHIDVLVEPKANNIIRNFVPFVGYNNIYLFASSQRAEPIGRAVRVDFFKRLNYEDGKYHRRTHFLDIKTKHIMGIFYPNGSKYPNEAFVYDYDEKTWVFWSFGTQDITAGISFEGLDGTKLKRGTAIGNSEGQLREFDFDSKNDDGVAIDAFWDSKVFTDPDDSSGLLRCRGVVFEAKGDSIDISFSTDEGVTFGVAVTQVLTNGWSRYTLTAVNLDTRTLVVRFANDRLDETFDLRYFAIRYNPSGTT